MECSHIKNILFLLLVLCVQTVNAEELNIPYVIENACPFEGCTFGLWEVSKDTLVYIKPDINSQVISKLKAGTKANIITGVSYISPGEAIIIGTPYSHEYALNPKEIIYILNYIGEGYSQIFQNGTFLTTKVARTKKKCAGNKNWRYCWVKVLKEPSTKWWVQVKDVGWVLMVNSSLHPIDSLSFNMLYNKSLKHDAGINPACAT